MISINDLGGLKRKLDVCILHQTYIRKVMIRRCLDGVQCFRESLGDINVIGSWDGLNLCFMDVVCYSDSSRTVWHLCFIDIFGTNSPGFRFTCEILFEPQMVCCQSL